MATPESKRLIHADFLKAALLLSVPVAAVKAVTEVESRGSGFYDDGRPVILFERHIMYRRLKDAIGPQMTESYAKSHPGVVNATPGGYRGGVAECDRLDEAAKIHRACALESASWGLFQIMGFHWQLLGYGSVQEFINAMYRDEAAQLDAFVRFVKANPAIWSALKAQDWAKFAKNYNGPNYAANKYDTKMAAAFERHDTELA
ncbi:N-acetylmuramidase family protein [Pandoraea apista]|uniref:N-acetylmuramidase family protein n=1 Tax=Pandoraea apista TaxID=93218 RepID=UPI00058A8F44|nr:N-acetylmuramidase family protein [Pandoraea apista]AJE99640.1 peptidoglycan-binding protein [Pandoraea apista]AKH73763.1 peptidoglycan-binding protein [Pandoraea apista]AKI62311.1 peptidoglycan-binding protein [Pandoraea apista]